MKKKKFSNTKEAARLRREEELKLYGKILSTRPAKVHKSGKEYKRINKIKLEDDED